MAAQDRGDDAEPTAREDAPNVPADDPTAPVPSGPTGPTPPGPETGADAAGPAGPPAGGPPVSPPMVGPTGTSVLPPTPGGPPPPPRWAARAQVPTPRMEEYADDWAPAPPPRSLLVPVLVTVSILVLFGVLGMAVWLMLDNRPGPVASPSATTVTTTTTTTTAPPTTTTTSPRPTAIQVPPLAGEEYEDAAEALIELGLEPEREDVFSDTVEEGLVISTDPTAGTRVEPGAKIIVFVSRGPEPTADPSPTGSASPSASPSARARQGASDRHTSPR